MKRHLTSLQSSMFFFLFLGGFLANVFFISSPLLGLLLLGVFVVSIGKLLGQRLAPQEPLALSFWMGSWLLLSLLSLLGALAYYAAVYTASVAIVLVLVAVPGFFLLAKHTEPVERIRTWLHDRWHETSTSLPGSAVILTAVAALGLVKIWMTFLDAQTMDAVRSLWPLVDPRIFMLFFVATTSLVALLMRGRFRALSFSLTSSTLLVILSTAILMFPLGYGFDTFIHQATEQHLANFGTITPKPLYYIGQYSLVLFAHHAFSLPVELVDTWLVPILSALFLPFAWFTASAHLLPNRHAATRAVIGLFLIPLGSFIVSTPQGLANLWTLIGVLAAIPFVLRNEPPRPWWLLLPALAAVVIHPIAGLPLLLFLALIFTLPRLTTTRLRAPAGVLHGLILVGGSVMLPASFVINSWISGLPLSLSPVSWNQFADLFLPLVPVFAFRFDSALDTVYAIWSNLDLLFLLISIAGAWLLSKKERSYLKIYGFMVAILAVNFLLLSTFFDFSFLIDYERQNYAQRLLPLMTFFLVPFFIVGFSRFLERVRSSSLSIQVGSVLLLGVVITSVLYGTYPRDDAYARHRGFNVSQSDVEIVRWIDQEFSEGTYGVLANQSTSAAAIKTIGFDQYIGEQFVYPIPTGGELYQLFLQMNERPSRETAHEALLYLQKLCANDTDCRPENMNTIVYVVSDFWWQSGRIMETAKSNADAWQETEDGSVAAFVYYFGE